MIDEELQQYREEIGAKEYKRIRSNYCNKSRRILQNNSRSSGARYENSEKKLKAIKEKYKNGITEDVLKKFVSEIF